MLQPAYGIFWAVAVLTGSLVMRCSSGDESVAFWEKTVNLRGALGYKDNVLLSNVRREGSAFWMSALDLSFFRLSLDEGPAVTFFVTAEDRRYFSSEELDKEQLVISQFRIDQKFLTDWKIGLIGQYMYADQIFDASATEQLLQTLPVKSHNLLAAPFISRDVFWRSSLELKFNVERQFFNKPLDDYWELGPQLTWKKPYGHKSEFSLSYTYEDRSYDTRHQLDLNYQEIAGTSLRFDQHEFEATLNHSWDEARQWRSRFRFLYEINQDNGLGFYDYSRYRWSKRIGYYRPDWQATVEGKILHYDYKRQRVLNGNETRSNWEFVLGLHAEKTIWKQVKAFVDSEHEIVDSNYTLEKYSVNTVLAGVDWEF
jgi:hypothetical protein